MPGKTLFGTDGGETINHLDGVTDHGDTIFGYGGRDFIYGHGGDDWLKGGGGADHLDGGTGNDTADYGDSWEGVSVSLRVGGASGGTAMDDTLVSIENLTGSPHRDIFTGTFGANTLNGRGGDDGLQGGGGADILDGGPGSDTANYSDSWEGVTVDLSHPTWTGSGGTAEGDILVSIENLTGSLRRDIFTGTDGANTLDGRGGDDWLRGGDGIDTLIGGSDNDQLHGGEGGDILNGGPGIDTADYFFWVGAPAVVVNLRTGVHSGGAAGDTLIEIENVSGSNREDTLVGDSNPNALSGWGATDRLEGWGGDDTLDGGTGADTLVGGMNNDTYIVGEADDTIVEWAGQGMDEVRVNDYAVRDPRSYTLTAGADIETLCTTNDYGTAPIDLTGNTSGNSVRGNDGRNVISGGGGNDTLTGRGGDDSFRFDTPLGAGNVDVIADLNLAGNDTIVLDDLIFGALPPGPLPAERFVTDAPRQHNHNIIYDADGRIYGGDRGALFYDRDGNGPAAAVQFATLSLGPSVTHDDFLVM